ncbi:hypothetical protein PQX77_014182 [Marasmius sp. AFHP31]|nr:hypothetical protein PQX77_014182 [Marasmius sp. AFHP31]
METLTFPFGIKVSRGKKQKKELVVYELEPDIFGCILSFLPLTSLVALAGTSQKFRDYMLDDDLFWVTFRRRNGIPCPPPTFTDFDWLVFLFTRKNTCEVCGVSCGAVIFEFYKRLCETCLVLVSSPTMSFDSANGKHPEECLKAIPSCPPIDVTGRRYLKEHMVDLLAHLPVPCPADNAFLAKRVSDTQTIMIIVAASRTYYYTTLLGRFLRIGIRPTTKALNLMEKSEYNLAREVRYSERDWKLFMDIFSIDLRHSIVSKTMGPRSRRTTMVTANAKFAWNLFLRQTVAPAATRQLFPFHVAMLHPKLRDHLLLRDPKTLRPNHLVELFGRCESDLADWVCDINDSLFLLLVNADLHDIALTFPSRSDLYDFMNWRPPATVFSRLNTFPKKRNGTINSIFIEHPSMWSPDDAFVEIKCFACGQVFSSSCAAIRHFDKAMGCLDSYEQAPNHLIIQKSLPSVALILLSGRLLTGTKAEVMDDDWTFFVKHFEEYDHGSLNRTDLDQIGKLFRIATSDEFEEYMESDAAEDWCCSHCHETLDKKLTRNDIIIHLEIVHLVTNPRVPIDMFYGGV